MSFKYEIQGHSFFDYWVYYGTGYPSSDRIAGPCLTLRSAKRKIRRHKRMVQSGKIDPAGNRYDINYTEERFTEQDVETRIRQLERELGIGQ